MLVLDQIKSGGGQDHNCGASKNFLRGRESLEREGGWGLNTTGLTCDRVSSSGFYHNKRHLFHVTVLHFRRKSPIPDVPTTDSRGTSEMSMGKAHLGPRSLAIEGQESLPEAHWQERTIHRIRSHAPKIRSRRMGTLL